MTNAIENDGFLQRASRHLLNWDVENNFQIGGVGFFSYVKFEFKGLSARVFYYQELWERGLKSSNEPLNTPV